MRSPGRCSHSGSGAPREAGPHTPLLCLHVGHDVPRQWGPQGDPHTQTHTCLQSCTPACASASASSCTHSSVRPFPPLTPLPPVHQRVHLHRASLYASRYHSALQLRGHPSPHALCPNAGHDDPVPTHILSTRTDWADPARLLVLLLLLLYILPTHRAVMAVEAAHVAGIVGALAGAAMEVGPPPPGSVNKAVQEASIAPGVLGAGRNRRTLDRYVA